MKQAYDLTVPSDYVELVSSSPRSFSIRVGGKLQDAILNDNWYQQVKAHTAWPLLQSVFSNYWNAQGNLDEIQTRFLDGLAWHSDAISEQDLGVRIVKLWTAIERVLSTSGGSSISARAAVLSSDTFEEFDKRSQELSVVYQRRSDVVHGNSNRANESWYLKAAGASEEASKATLFQYLFAIPHILALPGPTDRKKLQAWLKSLDNVAHRYRKQLHCR